MPQGVPGARGIALIIAGTIGVSIIMSLVTGLHGHWPFVLLGIVVGLWAVQSINK